MKSLFCLFSCLLLVACKSEHDVPAMQQAPTVPVLASTPSVRDVPVYVEAVGTLAPSVLLEVRPKVDGHLEEVFVKEGQWLHVGDPLFAIDSRAYENKLEELQAEIAKDRSALEVSLKKLERYKTLAQKELIAQNEWDELESLVTRAKNAIVLDEARLKAAELDLEHCQIKAAIAGRAGKLDAHIGQLVTAGQKEPLITISALDPLKVEFHLTEKDLARLSQSSLACEIRSLALSANQGIANISFIDNHFDSASGQILVRANVTNSDYIFRPGQAVRVKIKVATNQNALLVKQKAVKYNQQGPYVYLVQPDNSVLVREVKLGDEMHNDVVIVSGLELNDMVITEGHMRLFPGAKVEIKPEEAIAAS